VGRKPIELDRRFLELKEALRDESVEREFYPM
jgi:hypothetical protein